MQTCRRSQADLRGTSIGLPSLDQDRLLASAPGGRAWTPPFFPFLAKTGDSRRAYRLSLLSFQYQHTVFMGLSTGVYFSCTTLYVGKTGDRFLLVVVQDPIPRAHHVPAPPKTHCVAFSKRMYSHLSFIRQRSRTY